MQCVKLVLQVIGLQFLPLRRWESTFTVVWASRNAVRSVHMNGILQTARKGFHRGWRDHRQPFGTCVTTFQWLLRNINVFNFIKKKYGKARKEANMENSGIYREFKLFKKRSKILQESVPSFLKDGILVLLSALAYRNSKNGAAKVLALLMGGRTIVKATSRVLFLKPLLTLNEEGISFDPSVPIFDFRMAIAWEEIASIYINEVTITNSQSDKQDTTPKPSLP